MKSGVCIGGPYDGQPLSQASPTLMVTEVNNSSDKMKVRRVYYNYVPFLNYGMWIFEDLTYEEAFNRLSSAYLDAAIQKKQRELVHG
jgi:hypothetical protein